ncbi:hypothetical protein L596_002176 [Steinernema carpocapsae]|uniref:G-protein coupled receptors family 1 profile domain-containing protein n=1 Tax=Steinernema carpocapsae TaxID=34508 RepID=A0A4U8USE7_STECR|nr:hypothetical protein L596_002176 [Steinernema carpocapsae]
MIDIVYCFILVRLGRTFYFALLSNFGMITVERLIATIWHKTYEHGRSKLLTFTLMVGSYFPNICMLYYEVQHFYQLINSGMHLVGYCTSEIFDEIFYNPYPDFTATAVMIAYSSFTLIGFCFVRVYNCIKMQNIGTALTGRYQLRENINTSSFVAPLAFVFTVLNLISIIIIKCFNWISATSDDKLTVFAICKEATSLWIPIFSLCYPLLLLYHRKKEAEGNSRWLRFVRRASNIKSHFDSLVNRWWLWPGTRFSRRIRVFPYVPQS